MSKFKVGDLVIPSPLAKEKSLVFNKNAVFPWKVKKVSGMTVWLERYSKIGQPRTEMYSEDFWQQAKVKP